MVDGESMSVSYISFDEYSTWSCNFYKHERHSGIRIGQSFLNHFDGIREVNELRDGDYIWGETLEHVLLEKLRNSGIIVDYQNYVI